MIKVILAIGSFLAISGAAVILAANDGGTTPIPCKQQNELWGSEDGTKFYFCLPNSNIAIEQSCEPNTFFVRNATVTGCVPVDMMSTDCVYLDEVTPCTGANLMQPQTAKAPTQFYLCPSEGATPVLLNCPEGKAFVKQDGYLGCFAWASWRQIRNCPASN